ncbi:hypothetical protein Trydic_g16603 [Trypoxylus dichotomus]
MKVIIAVACFTLLACAYCQERPDCKFEGTPEFTMAYGEAFAIPEACLLIKCRGGNSFDISSNCQTLFRGAPADIATKKSREMGDKILTGKGCEASLGL